MGFHEFGPGSVRIEEIGLSLAIDAEMHLDGMIVSFEVGPGLQRLYTCCNIVNLQAKMMSRASVRRVRRVFCEHEFDVVVAIGDFEIDPGENGSR